MTVKEIVGLYDIFNKLSGCDVDLNTACTILDNIDSLSNPINVIEKRRTAIISKYAKKDEQDNIAIENNIILFDDSDKEALCVKELASFENEEKIDVSIKSIPKSALSDIKISAQAIKYLRAYLKDDTE